MKRGRRAAREYSVPIAAVGSSALREPGPSDALRTAEDGRIPRFVLVTVDRGLSVVMSGRAEALWSGLF